MSDAYQQLIEVLVAVRDDVGSAMVSSSRKGRWSTLRKRSRAGDGGSAVATSRVQDVAGQSSSRRRMPYIAREL